MPSPTKRLPTSQEAKLLIRRMWLEAKITRLTTQFLYLPPGCSTRKLVAALRQVYEREIDLINFDLGDSPYADGSYC